MNCVERFKELEEEKQIEVWNALADVIDGEHIYKNKTESYREICKRYFDNDASKLLDVLEYSCLDEDHPYLVAYVGYIKDYTLRTYYAYDVLEFVVFNNFTNEELREMLLRYWKIRKNYPELFVDEED